VKDARWTDLHAQATINATLADRHMPGAEPVTQAFGGKGRARLCL
jgi:hypothetical protein